MSRFCEGESMIKLYPRWKFCCLLVMLSCIPAGYAQDATHKILKKAPVQYPEDLKKRGISGTVRLKVHIKPDGSVKDTEVLGGSAVLAESAQKSVSQWKFSPASTETSVEVVVHFDPAAKSEN